MTTITISGLPGTGKTTVAKLLEKHLGLRYVYSGEIFRKTAEEHKMTLEEFGAYCEKHREVDEALDRYQLKELHKGDVILEGRLAGWLAFQHHIPALKVLLEADLSVRAARLVKREQGDVELRKKEILKRERSEATRYKKYYGIDIADTSIYDVVIDASEQSPEQIRDTILSHVKE